MHARGSASSNVRVAGEIEVHTVGSRRDTNLIPVRHRGVVVMHTREEYERYWSGVDREAAEFLLREGSSCVTGEQTPEEDDEQDL
jgi:hypothetical protein